MIQDFASGLIHLDLLTNTEGVLPIALSSVIV